MLNRALPIRDLWLLSETLSAVLESKAPLPAALVALTNDSPSARMRQVLQHVARDMEDGQALTDALKTQRMAFPPVGTGLFQVPLDLCARVMVDTVKQRLGKDCGLEEVVFVALDPREYAPFEAVLEKV